jgi:hypothetical protein
MKLWMALLLLLALACESEGEGGPGTACVPGRSAACACTDGASGAQVCDDDGGGYAACVCSSPADAVDDATGDVSFSDATPADVPVADVLPDDAPGADAPVADVLPPDADPADVGPVDAPVGDLPVDPDTPCVPDCAGKVCGTDGCNGSCGGCDDGDPDTADACNETQTACQHWPLSDCDVVAGVQVEEGEEVIPQTVLHLHGENSYANVGAITKYAWSVEQPALSTSLFVPTASYPSPTFEANTAGKYVFHLDVWNEYGQKSCFTAEATVFVVPDEAIHVELLWKSPGDPNPDDVGPSAGTDLDLHFAHPNASQSDLDGDGSNDPWFDPTWDTFWFYPLQNWGSVSSNDDNPSLDRDDVDSGGPENINLGQPEDGKTYALGVNYWDDHGFGNAFATVRVYVFSQLVFEVSDVALVDHDLWWVADLAWPAGVVSPKLQPNGGDWLTHDYHHPLFYQP